MTLDSESFKINKILREGNPLSSILFNIALEQILRDSRLYLRGNIDVLTLKF